MLINLKLKHFTHPPPPLPKQLTGILLLSVLVGGGFELEMSSLSGGIQVFYLNMEVSKGKDFSFPSGVAQKIGNIYLSQKNWPPNKSAHNVSPWDGG